MSQLRQPGDYLKNNRTVPPCVHTFTAEKTRTENKLLTDSLFLQPQEKTVVLKLQKKIVVLKLQKKTVVLKPQKWTVVLEL